MSNTGSPYSSDPWGRDDQSPSDRPAQPSQPTGWERPSSASSASSASSQSSASEWPGYPASDQPSAPEPTRPLSDPSAAGQVGYQPYEQQSMPSYGTGAPVPPSTGSYGGNPSEQNPYDQNPYPVAPYQPNPYQPYGAYQAFAAPPQHPQATTAFILGLLGMVICPPVGIGGMVMGGRVRREIDASGGQLGGRGLATAGWVLGIVSVVLSALYVLFILLAVVGGVMSSN